MCCLFGLIDYRDTLSCRQKTKMVRALAEASDLKFHLDHNKKFQSVLLALDNDSAGKKISKLIIKEFADRKDLCITEHYPSSKDWNQEITNFFRFGKPLSDIDFFKKSVTLHIKARKNIIER